MKFGMNIMSLEEPGFTYLTFLIIGNAKMANVQITEKKITPE
jgi:hypothetical protein